MPLKKFDRVKVTKGGDPIQNFYGSIVEIVPNVSCKIQIDDGRDAQSGGKLNPGPLYGPYSLVPGAEEVAPA